MSTCDQLIFSGHDMMLLCQMTDITVAQIGLKLVKQMEETKQQAAIIVDLKEYIERLQQQLKEQPEFRPQVVVNDNEIASLRTLNQQLRDRITKMQQIIGTQNENMNEINKKYQKELTEKLKAQFQLEKVQKAQKIQIQMNNSEFQMQTDPMPRTDRIIQTEIIKIEEPICQLPENYENQYYKPRKTLGSREERKKQLLLEKMAAQQSQLEQNQTEFQKQTIQSENIETKSESILKQNVNKQIQNEEKIYSCQFPDEPCGCWNQKLDQDHIQESVPQQGIYLNQPIVLKEIECDDLDDQLGCGLQEQSQIKQKLNTNCTLNATYNANLLPENSCEEESRMQDKRYGLKIEDKTYNNNQQQQIIQQTLIDEINAKIIKQYQQFPPNIEIKNNINKIKAQKHQSYINSIQIAIQNNLIQFEPFQQLTLNVFNQISDTKITFSELSKFSQSSINAFWSNKQWLLNKYEICSIFAKFMEQNTQVQQVSALEMKTLNKNLQPKSITDDKTNINGFIAYLVWLQLIYQSETLL
ncbi:Hypothetical_protein [Hexamita inflata]|uniref:Hypothetical_protein n=1 Tax=Hexamita inflata TaxID=28002 RepID=A0AA86RQV8_9EUKA|nr:Hypothetical protein HINF_LOCUS65618 [Hexamita inflata]